MAPPILSFENLGLVQGEGWLFRGLDIHVGPRDRLALTMAFDAADARRAELAGFGAWGPRLDLLELP